MITSHDLWATAEPIDVDGSTSVEPTLLVGSLEGEVALVRVRSGAVVWHSATHREVGTLAQDGTQAYIALGTRLRLLQGPRHRETPAEEAQRHARIWAEPTRLEARDVRTGTLRWRRDDWGLVGRLDVGTTAGMVLVTSTSAYGDRALYALDAATGARDGVRRSSVDGESTTAALSRMRAASTSTATWRAVACWPSTHTLAPNYDATRACPINHPSLLVGP